MKTDRPRLSDEEYIHLMETVPILTIDVLFFDRQRKKTLLFRRKHEPHQGKYFSCGGRLIKNENFIDCAIRKGWEEAGMIIQADGLFGQGVVNEIWPNSKFPGINYHAVNIFFGYELDLGASILLDEQHDRCDWFDVDASEYHPFIKQKIGIILK